MLYQYVANVSMINLLKMLLLFVTALCLSGHTKAVDGRWAHLDHCPLGGSAQVFTPLLVAFGSHLLCAEDSCLLRLQLGREELAGWFSSRGFVWEADSISTEYSTCLCCSVRRGVLAKDSGCRPVCAGFAVLLCKHGHFTSVSHFSGKVLKWMLDLSGPHHVCELLVPQDTWGWLRVRDLHYCHSFCHHRDTATAQ